MVKMDSENMDSENMGSWDNIKGPVMMIVTGTGLAIIISLWLIFCG